jgi:hypothetical protein
MGFRKPVMAISLTTPVPGPNGWYQAGELQKGSLVFDRWGNAQTVLSTHLYTPTKLYRLWYTDGNYVEIDPHQRIEYVKEESRRWHVVYNENRQRATRSDKQMRFKTGQEFFDGPLVDKRNRKDFSTPNTLPVHFYTEDLPVPPFIAGWWYANRNTNQARLTIHAKVKDYFIQTLTSLRWKVIKKKNGKIAIPQSIGTTMLTRYPTIPTKLPPQYVFGSIEQRIELLRGIMVNYPNSYKPKTDLFVIETRRTFFIKVIRGILESLGVRALESKGSLTFRTDIQLLPWQKKTRPHTAYKYRLIAEVHDIEPRPCIHIETEKPMLISAAYISSWQ